MDKSGCNLAYGLQVTGRASLNMWEHFFSIATHTGSYFGKQKLNKPPTKQKFGRCSPSNRMSIINHMWMHQWVWCGHNHTRRSCFGCQKLIKGPTRLKFGMWSPSNWVNIINCMWVGDGHGFIIATPTESHFG